MVVAYRRRKRPLQAIAKIGYLILPRFFQGMLFELVIRFEIVQFLIHLLCDTSINKFLQLAYENPSGAKSRDIIGRIPKVLDKVFQRLDERICACWHGFNIIIFDAEAPTFDIPAKYSARREVWGSAQ